MHLEGGPSDIGYQHGYLLAPEIRDTLQTVSLEMTHEEKKDWQFFRDKAQNMLWPHVEAEYRAELQGIADGAAARGVKLDVWDVVALNAWLEMPYFDKWDSTSSTAFSPQPATAEHCSAFVATGSYTKDGRVVIAHNNWTSYETGERWNIIFDIVPAQGNHILMDGMAGLIHSGDDFGVNSAGIMITETTISRFNGFDPDAIPEFVRARKAMQYSASIDDFARIMKDGNNGGYANNWLVADRKTNEVASLELGLKNVTLDRTRDGFFVGSNFPVDAKLVREETDFDVKDASDSANARHARWLQLMEQNKGKIDAAAAQRFLADHFDTFENKIDPDERSLCGHIDKSARGDLPWVGPYSPTGRGAVQSVGCRHGRSHDATCFAGPLLRYRIQGRRAPAQARRIRLAARRTPRHAVAPMDHVHRAVVGRASRPAAGLQTRPLIITVQAMYDRGAHTGKPLRPDEIAKFRSYQEKASREYAVSGIYFDVRVREDAYLRQQGYSVIPDQFLSRGAINLFITDYARLRHRSRPNRRLLHGTGATLAPVRRRSILQNLPGTTGRARYHAPA